jgi:hypothetical protein
MGLDDTDAKGLHSFLVVAMALLFSKEVGSNALHSVKNVQQRIAEELRKDQRTDHKAKFTLA